MSCKYEVRIGGVRKAFKTRAAAQRHIRGRCGASMRRVCSGGGGNTTAFKTVKCHASRKNAKTLAQMERREEELIELMVRTPSEAESEELFVRARKLATEIDKQRQKVQSSTAKRRIRRSSVAKRRR